MISAATLRVYPISALYLTHTGPQSISLALAVGKDCLELDRHHHRCGTLSVVRATRSLITSEEIVLYRTPCVLM